MECNKEEAGRCKAISEANFKRLDFVGARKYAVKARQLFPELEGLPQLLSILDVHVAAHQKLPGGEANWYGILQVDFRADDNTIRKQYRKLALVLHPDKNKAFGAEAAFKHVSEAWSVLSDRDKKVRFDEKLRVLVASHSARLPRGAYQNVNASRSSQVLQSKVNRSKSPNVHQWEHQGKGHVHQHQGQGQALGHQQEGQGQAHVHQYGQRQAHSYEQQGQSQACAHQQQGQSQTHAHRRQGQGQGLGQSQAHVYQRQWQGQTHPHQGQGQGETRVYQEQGQGQAPVHQQGHGQAYLHDQQPAQCQGQAHVHQQQGQGQVVAQGQGQAHAHQQQEHSTQHVHGQGHTEFPPEPHAKLNQAHTSKPSQPTFPHNKSTFWTACPSCRLQLEYERAYMNKNLCCPMCCRPFFSKEIAPIQGSIIWARPALVSKPALKTDDGPEILSPFDKNFDSADSRLPQMVDSNEKGKTDTEDNPLGQHGQKYPEATATPAQKLVELPQKGSRRLEKDELRKNVAVHKKEALERLIARSKGVIQQKLSEEKERKAAAEKASANGKFGQQNHKLKNAAADQMPASGIFVQSKREQEAHVYNTEQNVNNVNATNHNSNGSSKEIRASEKSSSSFLKSKPSGMGISNMGTSQRKRKLATPMDECIEDLGFLKKSRWNAEQSEGVLKFTREFETHERSLQVDNGDDLADCEMEVPDPDFHNFDGDRTEGHFSVGQIWASYDDDDGMPRYYTRVSRILSIQPLKMQMNWLEARNPSNETLAWLDSGFQHSCGDFKLGSTYIAEQVSTFSHLMAVDKVLKGHYRIYPRQGDVWALYKDWDTLKDKDDKRGYDMVEIIVTFEEERGVQVSPLFKVAGFKTIFERKPGEDHVKWIPSQELRRFSHQVPVHPIAACEVPGIQINCLELDPASTPMNLITGKQ